MTRGVNGYSLLVMNIIPHRSTYVEVDFNRLSANYCVIKTAVSPANIMAVIKANAYGHGMIEVARHMEQLNAPYFAVAIVEEGVQLRHAGITTPILVLGSVLDGQIPPFFEYALTITAVSIPQLLNINAIAKKIGKQATVHLNIDTGMGRLGIPYQEAGRLLDAVQHCGHCRIEGIYSHFATADESDLTFTHEQLRRFNSVLDAYDQNGLSRPPICHLSNSGGILQMENGRFDMVRAGIMLYGVYPSDETARTIPIQPALTWKSKIVHIKTVQPDQPISYGSTWYSDHQTRIATLPVGYGDGYFRSMTGRAEVLINGRLHPVVGRITMDQIMVNIENAPVQEGDEVTLIGESITAEELADWANTIPYEILTNINTRVPRLYIRVVP